MRTKQSVAIQDVANAAGVSVSTVSRVLNNRPDVAQSTRQRVLSQIKDMGYEPYVRATNGAHQRQLTLAIHYPMERYGISTAVTREFVSAHSSHFFGGTGLAARDAGYTLNIITTSITGDELLNLYQTNQISGLILAEIAQHDWRVNLLREHHLPFVMIGQSANNAGLHLVDIDHVKHIRSAFEYLHGLGHKAIAYLGYPADVYDQGFSPAVISRQSYAAVCQEYELPVRYQPGAFTPRATQQHAQQLLEKWPETTAIIVAYASATSGVIRVLHQVGRRVPDDCSIVATLATERERELMIPALTAYHFPMYEMGYKAANLLINQLANGPATSQQVLMETRLVFRESAGPVN